MINKNKVSLFPLIALGLVMTLTSNCKKEEVKKVPALTTAEITSITAITASAGGNISDDGGATITERGVCYDTWRNPNTASNKITADGTIGHFTCSLIDLTPGTTYYVRAFASNSIGTAYGNEIVFKTVSTIPILTTEEASSITITTSTCGGNITIEGGEPITERGVCYNTNHTPTLENSKKNTNGTVGQFSCLLEGLAAGTTYYARAYATNSLGTAYGNEISFTTYNSNAIKDVENNYYNIVTIGTQTWMKENLKVTKYNNGDPILNITDNFTWLTQTTGSYCWYNHDAVSYKSIYGALYNWYATSDTRKLCPDGWHIPTDNEWDILNIYLGGESIAGGQLKESGTAHWSSPNTGADNSTGFSALPGGYRENVGYFNNIGNVGHFWGTNTFGRTRFVNYDNSNLKNDFFGETFGASVRCVKD